MMAHENVLVEICLTSNDVILNVTGDHHPLPMYLKFGVPIALATDDPGVSRGDITQEFERAVETYHLKYQDLKKFARNSLEYSFLPGASLWSGKNGNKARQCAQDKLSDACSRLLEGSEKARQQWALEKAFSKFENGSRSSM
jgi:adenosine deaminase